MDFEIAPQQLADLRKLLVEIDFFRLKRAYHGHVIDGGQAWAVVQASGKQKRVYCNNAFPESFEKLFRFIYGNVVERRAEELKTLPLIDIDPEKEELVATWREFNAYVHASP